MNPELGLGSPEAENALNIAVEEVGGGREEAGEELALGEVLGVTEAVG